MSLLQQAIKDRCLTAGMENCYERPVSVFPINDKQDIGMMCSMSKPVDLGTSSAVAMEVEHGRLKREDYVGMNSIELRKILADQKTRMPDFATREQLIELILQSK